MNSQSQYLDQIISKMLSYAQLKFEGKLELDKEKDVDEQVLGLAVGVNVLGEELKYKVGELKRLNWEIEEKSNFINSVTNAVPEIIFVYNIRKNKITYINKCTEDDKNYPCPVVMFKITEPCNDCEIRKVILDLNVETFIERNDTNEIKSVIPGQKVKWYRTTMNAFEKAKYGEIISTLYTLTDITSLKEKELLLLKKEQTISNSLKEKELLLQEVHHRVKNNLQIISGLLDMQINRAESDEVVNQLKNIRNRIYTISLIHEELYQTEVCAQVNVSSYLVKLCNSLSDVYSTDSCDIKLTFDVEPEILFPLDKLFPFGLLINEIVCNSYKHAFRNEKTGEIHVKFIRSTQVYILEIKDNGEGCSDEDKSCSNKNSLGNKLIKGLTLQLGSILEVTKTDGYGVKIIFLQKIEEL